MKPDEAAAWVKTRAREIGFTHTGIARAQSLGEEGTLFDEWIRRGYHASMSWMTTNSGKRKNPLTILPAARSIISCTVNYYKPYYHNNEAGAGKISRYAWGDDYHKVVLRMLEELEKSLGEKFPSIDSKSYSDTGPVMEKAWAVRAGVGWLGKHANIITRDKGSWIFLGEIITSLELMPDAPMKDYCGSCTRCIDACPTHAIVKPCVVDSSKCLSYLTIEHKGEIDPSFEGLFNGWIFGCDICQDVCPWNRKYSAVSSIKSFAPSGDILSPSLQSLRGMTKEDFSARFSRSAIRRTKLEGLRRNIEFAMREVKPRESIK